MSLDIPRVKNLAVARTVICGHAVELGLQKLEPSARSWTNREHVLVINRAFELIALHLNFERMKEHIHRVLENEIKTYFSALDVCIAYVLLTNGKKRHSREL